MTTLAHRCVTGEEPDSLLDLKAWKRWYRRTYPHLWKAQNRPDPYPIWELNQARLIDGVPGFFDDVIALTRQQQFEKRDRLRKRRDRLAAMMAEAEEQILEADREIEAIAEAARTYEESGLVDDILRPHVDDEIKKRQAKAAAEERKAIKSHLDLSRVAYANRVEGFDIHRCWVDDEFINVHVRQRIGPQRRLPPPTSEPEMRARAARMVDYLLYQAASSFGGGGKAMPLPADRMWKRPKPKLDISKYAAQPGGP